MKRPLALLACLATLLFAACGETVQHSTPVVPPASSRCAAGVMGGCVQEHQQKFTESLTVPIAVAAGATPTLPDVSEYQGCTAPTGSFIYRIYEAGSGLEDSSAVCHSHEAKRVRWSGAYYFARPGSCVAQAQKAISIAKSLPHRPNVLIVDAEVALPTGYIKCADATIKAGGFPYVNYAGRGLAPIAGGPFQPPIWQAEYGVTQVACLTSTICSRVAWQYTDAEYCHGIYGDCSYDYGITRLGAGPSKAQIHHAALIATVHRLARWQAHWHCGKLPKSNRVEKWCGGWEHQKLAARRALGLPR